MGRPMIHNHYLPSWMGRIANGVLACLWVALAASSAYLWFPAESLGESVSAVAFWAAPVVGLLAAVVNPRSAALAEGIAGELGYDEWAVHR